MLAVGWCEPTLRYEVSSNFDELHLCQPLDLSPDKQCQKYAQVLWSDVWKLVSWIFYGKVFWCAHITLKKKIYTIRMTPFVGATNPVLLSYQHSFRCCNKSCLCSIHNVRCLNNSDFWRNVTMLLAQQHRWLSQFKQKILQLNCKKGAPTNHWEKKCRWANFSLSLMSYLSLLLAILV